MKVLAVEFLDYAQPPGPVGAPSDRVQQLVAGKGLELATGPNGVTGTVGKYAALYPWSIVRRVMLGDA